MTFSVCSDLTSEAEALVAADRKFVLAEEHPDFPNCMLFSPWDGLNQDFYRRYSDWISRHLILNELFSLTGFVERLTADGYAVLFAPSCKEMLSNHEWWGRPLEIPDYTLHPFQTFSLNQAIERATKGNSVTDRLFFFNWSAGAGKSYCSGAGARALYEAHEIDLVLAFTLGKLKINLSRFFEHADLRTMINDHPKPAVRQARYDDEEIEVYVANYEKLWVDFDALLRLTSGRSVLFVLDECHKVINDGKHNRARQCLERLVKNCRAILWPMSATVVNGNPLRYRDVYSLDGLTFRSNPLGSKADFVSRYAESVKTIPIRTKRGGRFNLETYKWDLHALQEVRHRVSDRTMAVRKTDAAVRDNFKGIQTIQIPVQASPETRELFDIIEAEARKAHKAGENLMPFYRLLRYAAINPAVLALTEDEIGQRIAADHPQLIDAKHSAKIEILRDMLEEINQAQDKVVLFCHYTHLGLLPLQQHLNVKHVLHYGEQSAKESQRAQEDFLANPEIVCFASSDAGSHGLNLPVAKYVINVDPTYSYDDLMQRNSRIDRLDSHLDGLTAFVLVTEDSVEERVWDICNQRRMIAAAIQGTREELSYGPHATRTEGQNLSFLVFGEDE